LRLEADPGSAIAEGEIGCMAEAQRGSQIEARTGNERPFAVDMRLGQSGREVNAGAAGPEVPTAVMVTVSGQRECP